MIFVFDLDDTVCDTDGYSEKYIKEFFTANNMPYKQISTNARFAEQKFDWDKNLALDWYKTYGDEMMLNFPCKSNAVELINTLHDLGHKIIIATARANDWHDKPKEITLKWLKKNNIKYDDIYIGRIDKERICEEVKANIFIDDDINITAKVAKYFNDNKIKGQSFLMNTEYNSTIKESEGVIRVNNFDDFADKLKEFDIII